MFTNLVSGRPYLLIQGGSQSPPKRSLQSIILIAKINTLDNNNVGEDVEKSEPSYITTGNVNGATGWKTVWQFLK